jgi:hypothetical protein
MKSTTKGKPNPKFEILNNWIKSCIDIDKCIERTKEVESYVYAVKIDAIKSIDILISTGIIESYTIGLNTGGEGGLAIYYDDRAEFDKDLLFFENLLIHHI